MAENGDVINWRVRIRTAAFWKSLGLKLLISAPFWYTFIILGVSTSIVGPTLLLLKENVKSEAISWIFTSRSIGYCLGAFLSGFWYDLLASLHSRFASSLWTGAKLQVADPPPNAFTPDSTSGPLPESSYYGIYPPAFSDDEPTDDVFQPDSVALETVTQQPQPSSPLRAFFLRNILSIQAFQSVFLLLLAVATALHPFVDNVYLLIFLQFVTGLANGLVEIGSDIGIAWIWGEGLAAPVQCLHFSYGVGAFVFPSVVAQILEDYGKGQTALVMSYVIAAVLSVSPIILFLIIPSPLFRKEEEESKTTEEEIEKEEEEQSTTGKSLPSPWLERVFSGIFWLVISLFYVFYCAGEMVYGSLMVSYSVSKGLEDEVSAARLNSLFYLAFTLGRLFGILESKILPLYILVMLNILLCMIFNSVMVIWPNDLWIFRVFSVLMGAGMSVIYPTQYAIPTTLFKFPVGGIVTSFTLLGASAGIGLTTLVTHLMNAVDLEWFHWSMIILSATSLGIVWFELGLGKLFVWILRKKGIRK